MLNKKSIFKCIYSSELFQEKMQAVCEETNVFLANLERWTLDSPRDVLLFSYLGSIFSLLPNATYYSIVPFRSQ